MTLYFQVQFLKLKCTENSKSTIKIVLKSEKYKKSIIIEKNIEDQKKKPPQKQRDILEI